MGREGKEGKGREEPQGLDLQQMSDFILLDWGGLGEGWVWDGGVGGGEMDGYGWVWNGMGRDGYGMGILRG